MHNLYSMCLISVLTVGYAQVKAFPTEVQCGAVGRRKGRIINGEVAEVNQIPWIASIKRNGVHNCGGTIISRKFVLTAAHCFDIENSYGPIVKARDHPGDLEQWTVTVGDYSQAENEEHSLNLELSKIIFPKAYKKSSLIHDIVLLELKEEIQWTDFIQPICLPEENIEESDKAIAAGWGRDISPNVTAKINNKLRYVELNIFNNKQCNSIYSDKNLGISLHKTQMCAGKLGEVRDTTEGDSGGPLLINRNGREIIVGLTSSGTRESIFPKAPGIYTRIYEYLDWIREHTKNSKTFSATLHNQH